MKSQPGDYRGFVWLETGQHTDADYGSKFSPAVSSTDALGQ